MRFAEAIEKAKANGKKLGLPGVTSFLDVQEIEQIRLRPYEILSSEWQLQPRQKSVKEVDVKLAVKRALAKFIAASEVDRATEEVLDCVFE